MIGFRLGPQTRLVLVSSGDGRGPRRRGAGAAEAACGGGRRLRATEAGADRRGGREMRGIYTYIYTIIISSIIIVIVIVMIFGRELREPSTDKLALKEGGGKVGPERRGSSRL